MCCVCHLSISKTPEVSRWTREIGFHGACCCVYIVRPVLLLIIIIIIIWILDRYDISSSMRDISLFFSEHMNLEIPFSFSLSSFWGGGWTARGSFCLSSWWKCLSVLFFFGSRRRGIFRLFPISIHPKPRIDILCWPHSFWRTYFPYRT